MAVPRSLPHWERAPRSAKVGCPHWLTCSAGGVSIPPWGCHRTEVLVVIQVRLGVVCPVVIQGWFRGVPIWSPPWEVRVLGGFPGPGSGPMWGAAAHREPVALLLRPEPRLPWEGLSGRLLSIPGFSRWAVSRWVSVVYVDRPAGTGVYRKVAFLQSGPEMVQCPLGGQMV